MTDQNTLSAQSAAGTTRLLVGPFNRVEGDLEVRLEIADGRVAQAQVSAPMYRGFETMLLDRPALDALTIVPRICGICSVSQSVAAARALADVMRIVPPANGLHAINLMLACENLADHLTHFYLFFMPDFARPVYRSQPWYDEVVQRFAAPGNVAGVAAGLAVGDRHRQALLARQRWFQILGLMGGKWPHTGSIRPGGSSRALDASERLRLLARLREFRNFLQQTLFADSLDRINEIRSEAQLWAWYDAAPALRGDFRAWLTLARSLQLDTLGAGPGLTLSYGAYPQPGGGFALAPGVWQARPAAVAPASAVPMQDWLAGITEDVTHSWLAYPQAMGAGSSGDASAASTALHPQHGLTLPQMDKPQAYTWNKAPRLHGQVIETGAIARQLADRHPLITDAVQRCGANVYTRVLARLIELARVLPMMQTWLQALEPGAPFFAAEPVLHDLPDGQGVGLSEAARGALGHWIETRNGRIAHYQIIAPTSWNFSPRDAQGQPGALEQALQGVTVQQGPADDATTPVAVQHVVRSFDPCMVCTVH